MKIRFQEKRHWLKIDFQAQKIDFQAQTTDFQAQKKNFCPLKDSDNLRWVTQKTLHA
ncbi:MAG: hypothetical protein IKO20_07355 [Bacteroidaceae bacterium]|nr:hypothetical protein [Bacteroidaceae bacterium]